MTLQPQSRPRRQPNAATLCLAIAVLASACSSSGSSTTSSRVLDNVATAPVSTVTPALVVIESFERTATDEQVQTAIGVFVDSSTSANARALVETVAGNRNERWVPWLIDLLRINTSNRVSELIRNTLEAITGIESRNRVADMNSYGSWSQTRELDGGAGYVDFKATLYERIDGAFGPLIRSVVNQAEVAAIQWGGVGIGGIPELNDPARVPAAEADWMIDDEIVLGVIVNDEAVAYPLRILARHELANDTIGGEDLALVYCTLCRSALVFERDVAGQKLDFLTSGLLLNSNKIMYDPQTGTLWSHLRGIGIGGPLIGTELVVRPVNHLRWSDWIAENPDSEVLELPRPIFFDIPDRPPIAYDYTPGEAYRSYYDNPDVWFPVRDVPGVFSIKTEVVGISRNGDDVAFDVTAFNALKQTTQIEVGGELLTVEPTGVGVRVFDASGDRILTEQSFWFAWHANHPDTRTLDF
jgi:hypothetical protein